MATEPGSPEVTDETPAFDWESDDNPYRKRFMDYRVEADRRATVLSQYEQDLEALRSDDLEAQRDAAARLQIELVEEEPEPMSQEPWETVSSELAQLKAQIAADKKAQQQEREQERLAVTIESRLDALGDIDESDKDLILARAIAMPVGEDGLPNVKGAYDELVARDTAREEAAMQRWASSKKAPRSIKPGQPGTETKDIMSMSDEERIEWATQRLEGVGA